MMSHKESSEGTPKKLEIAMSERRGDQLRRKRASKACLACRRRKVRCDVAHRGPPCMNCFLDKEDCVVKPRSSTYKRAPVLEQVSAVRQNSTDISSDNPPTNMEKSPSMAYGGSTMQDTSNGHANVRIGGDELRYNDHAARDVENRMPRVGAIAMGGSGFSNDHAAYSSPSLFERSSAEQDLESSSIANTHIMFSYYPFLKLDAISKISPCDVKFLENQGCFGVPTRPILDEFIQEYFLHVHPILPIINEKTFWMMYVDSDSNATSVSRISLLVFHAMLFASASFVSLGSIQKLGFAHNRSARALYYRRAKFLFEFDGEADPLSIAQATLLMSYFSPMRRHPKENTYWLGIAIHFAKQAEAHRYQTNRNVNSERRNMLKRVWWCCILRDRILPLGLRKSIQVTPLDFDIKTQTPLLLKDLESEIESSKVYDTNTKRALAQRLVALCELAIILTDVMLILYPEKEPFAQLGQSDPLGAVQTCKSELNTWFEKTAVKYLTSPSMSKTPESVVLYTNLMYIYYHSALLALCNYEVLLATTGISLGPLGGNSSVQIFITRRQIEDAINGVTENLKELVQLKLAKYMPISAVAYVALPLVLHLLDVKLSNMTSQNVEKQRRLSIYTEAMTVLQSQYDATNAVLEIIGKMVEYISLHNQESQRETPSNHSEADLGSLASKSTDDPSVVQNWGDLILRQPKLYLRLTTTMDLSLFKGIIPTDSDFPLALQSKMKPGVQFPPYYISMHGRKTPDQPPGGLPNVRLFNGAMEGRLEGVANDQMTGRFDRSSTFAPNDVISPLVMDTMNFETSGFELPMGFEAFDIELSSKRGFDFDFPWGTDTTPLSEPI